ncbi:hypothetical protein [Actinokineospora inagensis]|uniref:hypothetical protein n=1 Tax=Actinokineospora inagensis TaxID=103730 RepID=UPI000428A93C|nr:hypothetical protein [Actinokineospora inagensis]
MADPTIPATGDFTTASYEQILFAITGLGSDLMGMLDSGGGIGESPNTWFTFTPPGSAANSISYHAWDKYYFGADFNMAAFNSWYAAWHAIDDAVTQAWYGKSGLMDVQLLRDSKTVTDNYLTFLTESLNTTKSWGDSLDSDDSAFKGKAAFAIQVNLRRLAFTFNDLHDQITLDRTPSTPTGIDDAATALSTFGKNMWQIWSDSRDFLLNAPMNTANTFVANVIAHIKHQGLDVSTKGMESWGEPSYLLDQWSAKDRGKAEQYIRDSMALYASNRVTPPAMPTGFPVVDGDLTRAETWNAANNSISEVARVELRKMAVKARTELATLEAAYRKAGRSLGDLKTNQPPTIGSPPPDPNTNPNGPGSGDPNIPPPPNGDTNVPPPPNGDTNVPPPPNGGIDGPGGPNPNDFPNGSGSGSGLPDGFSNLSNDPSKLGDPPNGGTNFPGLNDALNPNGGTNGGGLPGGGDGGTGLPFLPNLPNGGKNSNGGANGGTNLPNLPNVENPGDGHIGDDGWEPNQPNGSTHLPGGTNLPGSNGGVPGFPGGAPGGPANGGIGLGPGSLPGTGPVTGLNGIGGLPGADGSIGGAGGGLDSWGAAGGGAGVGADGSFGAGGGFGANGGAGTGAGSPFGTGSETGWSDWSGHGSDGANAAGGPGGAGAEHDQRGGMPFFPPMMGGMGGMGGRGSEEKERERTTWLSEDEKIWGTDTEIGFGVIGRPDSGAPEIDEPLVTTHVHLRSTTSSTRQVERETRQEAEGTATANG